MSINNLTKFKKLLQQKVKSSKNNDEKRNLDVYALKAGDSEKEI